MNSPCFSSSRAYRNTIAEPAIAEREPLANGHQAGLCEATKLLRLPTNKRGPDARFTRAPGCNLLRRGRFEEGTVDQLTAEQLSNTPSLIVFPAEEGDGEPAVHLSKINEHRMSKVGQMEKDRRSRIKRGGEFCIGVKSGEMGSGIETCNHNARETELLMQCAYARRHLCPHKSGKVPTRTLPCSDANQGLCRVRTGDRAVTVYRGRL